MCARKAQMLLFGLIAICLGIMALILGGQTTVLRCTRPEPSRVVCVKQVKWLGAVPVREETVEDVRRAVVDEHISGVHRKRSYRVELISSQGNVPLTAYYSTPYWQYEETAAQINAYLKSDAEDTFEIREGNALLAILPGGGLIVAGLVLIFQKGRRG